MRNSLTALLCVLVLTVFANLLAAQHGRIVVANRGSGDISVLSARTGNVLGTFALPGGANKAEPMYVVAGVCGRRVFVGDRANSCVVVFRRRDFSVEKVILTGKGVFHMWADFFGRVLWVNNDIDNTASVINMRSLTNVATVPMPADLVAKGGKPHDVVLSPFGRHAFVSMVGVAGANDYVVKFSTATGNEMTRAAVGKDPHVSLTWRNGLLYVPTQNANEVRLLRRSNLSSVGQLSVPNAHGAGMPRLGRYLYVTNIAGGGIDGLFTIDTRTNQLVGNPVNTPFPVPHNAATTPLGRAIFVTHSGATADKVTMYRANHHNPTPVFVKSITVGTNPFGLAWVR